MIHLEAATYKYRHCRYTQQEKYSLQLVLVVQLLVRCEYFISLQMYICRKTSALTLLL